MLALNNDFNDFNKLLSGARGLRWSNSSESRKSTIHAGKTKKSIWWNWQNYAQIERWSVPRLGRHFDQSPETIQMHICKLRAGGIETLDLEPGIYQELKNDSTQVSRGARAPSNIHSPS